MAEGEARGVGRRRRQAVVSELIFLGTGSSTGVPTPRCVTAPTDPPCAVCHSALATPPELSRNYRHGTQGNPSLLIRYVAVKGEGDGRCDGGIAHAKHIQIDCGKTFREAMLRWFPRYGVPSLDALLLTHEHADAILGMDDLRGLQPDHLGNGAPALPVYLSAQAFGCIRQVVRRVAQLSFNIIEADTIKPFNAAGLHITPLPVMHGEDFVALGFLFGTRQRVGYISDASRLLDSTEALISSPPVDLLILDALFVQRTHNTHFNLPQSLEVIKRVRPKRALLTGMTHEFDHDVVNAELAEMMPELGIDVQLAYDGLRIPIDL
eukprot:jgi/Chlat1/7729/Chrsp66S00567